MIRVFVYGSLLSGLHNHGALRDSVCIKKDEIAKGFLMFDIGNIPACIHTGKSWDVIMGEVYEVNKETFNRLDRLEGFPSFYDRIEYKMLEKPVWIYIHRKISQIVPLVASGDWREYYTQKQEAR